MTTIKANLNNLRYNVLLLVMLWNFNTPIFSQTIFCPPNIDFESGNLSNWRFYTGTCCPIIANTFTGAIANRHVLTSGVATDYYGGFPIVAPSAGNYSLKLGNNGTGSLAEKARYYIRIPAGNNNYKLIFRYAVVFENPSDHLAFEQPRFEVKAFDSITNFALSCVQFNFVSSSSLPGFLLSSNSGSDPIYYKTWSTAGLDLSGFSGRTVAIDFASGDCDLGGHFGYGYVDVNCGLFQVSTVACKGSINSTLTGPPGFLEYKWYDSTYSTNIGNTQTISVPTPTTYNKYVLIVKPYVGYGCPDTLTSTLRISDLDLQINKDTTVCNYRNIQLQNSANVSSYFQPLLFNWTPTTGLSCTTCLNPVASPAKTTTYTLSVTDANGCVQKDSFTVTVRIYIDSQPKDTTVCLNSKAKFKVVANGIGPFSYKWRKNGVNIPGETTDSLIIQNTNYTDTADYSVLVIGDCDSIQSSIAKLKIFSIPVITLQPQNKLQCPKTKAVFKSKINNFYPVVYQWKKNFVNIIGANKDSLVLNNIAMADTGKYYLQITDQCKTIYTDTVQLSLFETTTISTQPQSVTQCLNTKSVFKVIANGAGTLTYQWKKGTQILIGQNADSLVINNINHSDTGNYTVKVWSLCDSATSTIAKLSIFPGTKITVQPQSITQCLKSKAILKVKATGTGIITYQWLKKGLYIPNATTDSLVINNLSASDSANYSVLARSFCDSVFSTIARIDLFAYPNPNLPDTSYLCTEIGKLTVTGFKSYLWNTGNTNNSINIPTNGIYWVKVTDNNGCTNTDTTFVLLNSAPFINAGPDTVLCNQLPIKLNATAINYDSILWINNTFGVFENNKSFTTKYQVDSAVTGVVTITFSATNNCGTATDDLLVNYTPIPNPDFTLSDTLVCQGSAKVLLTPIDAVGYFSGKNVNGNSFDPIDNGIFPIKYQLSRNFCSNQSTKFIDVVPQPIANFSYESLVPDIDEPVQFFSKSTNENQYLWTFENNKTSTLKNSSYHFTEEGIYNVELKAINRICFDTAVQLILVKGSKFIYMPNAFTPNQNGLNDAFKVVYKNSRGATLHIYNRWGQWLYTSSDLTKGWNGTFNGNPCEVDVYYYLVDYITNDGFAKQLKGNFTLLR